jgi:hypothetical protein
MFAVPAIAVRDGSIQVSQRNEPSEHVRVSPSECNGRRGYAVATGVVAARLFGFVFLFLLVVLEKRVLRILCFQRR